MASERDTWRAERAQFSVRSRQPFDVLTEAFLVSDPGTAPVRADDAMPDGHPAPRVHALAQKVS